MSTSIVDRAGEEVARSLSRRHFFARSATAVFGLAAAWSVGTSPARADGPCPNSAEPCNCQPIGNVYCNSWSASYCNGSACAGGCTYYLGAYHNGCWCTKECCYGGGARSGYYRCCDCSCSRGKCTCHAFVLTCGTAPASADNPHLPARSVTSDVPVCC